jgi:hypothetical protein
MVGGERRSYRTDAYGNLISQSTGRTDGSYDIRDYDKFHNGNYTETFVDAKGQSQSVHIDASSPWQPRIEQAPAMPGGVMILGKVVDRSQTLDAFLEKIKERQNRGAVDGHGSTASRNKSPESTN